MLQKLTSAPQPGQKSVFPSQRREAFRKPERQRRKHHVHGHLRHLKRLEIAAQKHSLRRHEQRIHDECELAQCGRLLQRKHVRRAGNRRRAQGVFVISAIPNEFSATPTTKTASSQLQYVPFQPCKTFLPRMIVGKIVRAPCPLHICAVRRQLAATCSYNCEKQFQCRAPARKGQHVQTNQ